MIRNAANKMTNPIDPGTENNVFSFIEISERNGSVVVTPALFDYQGPCTARYMPMHSCVTVVYPNLELICDFGR